MQTVQHPGVHISQAITTKITSIQILPRPPSTELSPQNTLLQNPKFCIFLNKKISPLKRNTHHSLPVHSSPLNPTLHNPLLPPTPPSITSAPLSKACLCTSYPINISEITFGVNFAFKKQDLHSDREFAAALYCVARCSNKSSRP